MDKIRLTASDYHHRTKHSLDRYARAPETIDWDDQPDPFRRFSGSKKLQLKRPGAPVANLYSVRDNSQISMLSLDNISLLLELAFGLSAWKQMGPDRWSLRCNPSSGNLHPSEVYLIHNVEKISPAGVYHYLSYDHSLEQRCQFTEAIIGQGVFIGFSSIHWREAWKYGERAFRYCQHDIGHGLAALRYAAANLGWSVAVMDQCSDQELEQLMGLNRPEDFISREGECADMLCRIDTLTDSGDLAIAELVNAAENAQWSGKAESLKAYHMYHWPVIDEIAQVTKKPVTEKAVLSLVEPGTGYPYNTNINLAEIIRQRRSAQSFDAFTSMDKANFLQLLAALMPVSELPFDMWPWSPKIHLCLFVHRVTGLQPGVYVLPRSEQGQLILQEQLLQQFSWQKLTNTGAVPLYMLQVCDCRNITKTLSCHQPIASDGVFTLAMLAEFSGTIIDQPWHYRRLFWECGLLGQILYLQAEMAGMRGTGIGCYFDDSVHEVLGIKNNTLQSLYHFTVGKALTDQRLKTLPAYAHLQDSV